MQIVFLSGSEEFMFQYCVKSFSDLNWKTSDTEDLSRILLTCSMDTYIYLWDLRYTLIIILIDIRAILQHKNCCVITPMVVPLGGLGGLFPPKSKNWQKLSKKYGINLLGIPLD